MTFFRTDRLEVVEVGEDDLDDLLAARLSNPAYLELTEGSAGVAGHYDRGMLERDLTVAALEPGRHTAAVRLRDGDVCVGELDWLDRNPRDGSPWLGFVGVHADHQRRGIASEATRGLAAHGRAAVWTRVREGVLVENVPGMALARSLGFREVERRMHRIAAGERELAVLELAL